MKNEAFLKALGEHCAKIRLQKGLSIDRLSRESERFSPSVIHRLESGSGPVTVSVIARYAKALEIHPKALFDFELPEDERATRRKPRVLSGASEEVQRFAYRRYFPLLSAKAAAGVFGQGEDVQPMGWIELKPPRKAPDEKLFILQAKGDSMEPRIHDGDFLLFRAHPVGTRQGKIVLVQYRGPSDPETGGSYSVKQYFSSKVSRGDGEWRHRQITLTPLNPDYEPIILQPRDESDFMIIAEYLGSLGDPAIAAAT